MRFAVFLGGNGLFFICIFIHILKIYVEITVDFAVKVLGFI